MPDNTNDISGKVGLDTTDFKSGITTLNQQIKVIDSGFRAAAAGMTDWGKNADGLKGRIDALNKMTDLQKRKIAGLSDEYRKIATEKGADSKAARDMEIRINKETEALNKNESELRKVTASLDDMGKETDQLGDSVDDTNKKLSDFGGKAGPLVAGAVAAIGAATAAAVVSMFNFSAATDKAMNGFQASTGATVEEMEGFRDVAKDIYTNNFGDSIDDVAASMAIVNQTTKETGEALQKTTEQAILLRDTFGFEVAESTNTANSLMAKFGITSEQAFTLIAQGAQNGANKNGDLIDSLNEYAPAFADLGFSADEFTGILIEGAKEGAFQVDKVGDAMKEFGIRSKDFSDSSIGAFQDLGMDSDVMFEKFAAGGSVAKEAFGDVITALANMDDPLAQNLTGVALFGSMFEDMGLKSILALGNVSDKANMTKDTLQQMNDVKYDDIGSAVEGLKRKFEGAFTEMPAVKTLTDAINKIDVKPLTDGLQWLIDNSGTIAAGATAIGVGMLTWNVIAMVTGLIGAVKGWALANQGLTLAQGALNLVMAANPIGIVITIIAALVAGIIVLWKTNEGFREAVKNVWKAISGAVIGAYDAIKATLGRWGEIGKAIIAGIKDGIVNAAKGLAVSVIDAAKGALKAAKNFLGIKSPSRLFKEQVGAQIGAGMAEGIAESGKKVNAAMAGINTKLVSSIDISKAGASGSGSRSVVVNVPLFLDGQQITRSTGSIQQGRNKSRSRALGVVPG